MKIWTYDIALNPWPVLAGFLQGLGFYLIRHGIDDSGLLKDALGLFLIITPPFLMLTLRSSEQPRDCRRDLLAAVGVGGFFALLYALLYASVALPQNDGGLFDGFHFSAIVASFILLSFYQPAREAGVRNIPYPALFQAAWANLLLLVLSGLFTFVVFLVLTLWGQLFSLIGLDLFEDIFGESWFGWPFYSAAFGLGIALLRELDAPVLALRRLILVTFRVLAVIVAFAGLLFLLALPFTGLQPLWETRRATPILISMMAAFVIFVNGAIQDGSEQRIFWRPAALLVKAFLLALPLYGGLALYSTWLRVSQYGLTPERVEALVLTGLATLYGLAYAAAVLMRRRGWVEGLTLINPRLALATVLAGILVYIPGIDALSLSARNQLSRLQSGQIAAADFDFGALKFKLGKPGQRALDDIRHDPALSAREDIQATLADLAGMNSTSDWRVARQKTRAGLTGKALDKLLADLQGIPLFPSSALMPDRFLPAFVELDPAAAKSCIKDDATCALILLDFNRDGYDDTALWQGGETIRLYLWDSVQNSYNPAISLTAPKALTLQDLQAADEEGGIRTIPARVDNLVIGNARFE